MFERERNVVLYNIEKHLAGDSPNYSLGFEKWMNLNGLKCITCSMIYIENGTRKSKILATRTIDSDWSEHLSVFQLEKCVAAIVNFRTDQDELLLSKLLHAHRIPIVHCFGYVIDEIIDTILADNQFEKVMLDGRQYLLDDLDTHQQCDAPTIYANHWQTKIKFLEHMNAVYLRNNKREWLPSVQTVLRNVNVLAMARKSIVNSGQLSLIRPIMEQVQEKLNDVDKDVDHYDEDISCDVHLAIKKTIQSWSNKMSPEADLFLKVATFLDPRFHRSTNASDLVHIKQKIRSFLEPAASPSSTIPTKPSPMAKKSEKKVNSDLNFFFGNKSRVAKAVGTARRDPLDVEIENYMLNVDVPFDECPLDWWQPKEAGGGALFPQLRRAAERYQCVAPILIGAVLPVQKQIDRRIRYWNMIGLTVEQICKDVFLYENRLRECGDHDNDGAEKIVEDHILYKIGFKMRGEDDVDSAVRSGCILGFERDNCITKRK